MSSSTRLTPRARQLLRELPARVLMFLQALSTYEHLRDALLPRGYTLTVHNLFWRVLLRFVGFLDASTGPVASPEARAATEAVARWQEPTHRVGRVTLKHDFAEQHDFVFGGLVPIPGAGSLVSVAMLLDRLDALENSPERKKTRKTDLAALDKLAERGITPAVRQHIRAQLALATRASELDPNAANALATAGAPRSKALNDQERAQALQALRAMFEEWSEVARVEITSRADLIRLGLVKRRRNRKDDEPNPRFDNVAPPAAPARTPSLPDLDVPPQALLLPVSGAAPSAAGEPEAPTPAVPKGPAP